MLFANFLLAKTTMSKLECTSSTNSIPGIPIPSAKATKEERDFQLAFYKKKWASMKQQFMCIADHLEDALQNEIELPELTLIHKNLMDKF